MLMGMGHGTVNTMINEIKELRVLERSQKGFNVYELAERLERVTDLAKRKAIENKDWNMLVNTEHKYVLTLDKLGVINKPQRDREIPADYEQITKEITEVEYTETIRTLKKVQKAHH